MFRCIEDVYCTTTRATEGHTDFFFLLSDTPDDFPKKQHINAAGFFVTLIKQKNVVT